MNQAIPAQHAIRNAKNLNFDIKVSFRTVSDLTGLAAYEIDLRTEIN
ncbi:MAG: hypothetical protein ACI9O6_001134 [Glaciecola sp.]|jgi:hypothetical protein